jgi:hypothetical protein
MLLYVIVLSIANILLWQNVATIIYRAGQVIDVLGGYIILRSLIRDREDIERVIRLFVIICIIIAAGMTVEYVTGKNPFSLFGAELYSAIREGRTRCSGPFVHPILAGTFGAVVFPLFVYLWMQQNKKQALAGICASLIIVFTSISSTSVFTFIMMLMALCMYPLRRHMRAIRWGLIIMLISLHMYMKAPVWALIGRMSAFNSSTSYRRYLLIDQFINRFNEWFLVGTKSTAMGHEAEQMFDVTNQYVRTGVDGGILSSYYWYY